MIFKYFLLVFFPGNYKQHLASHMKSTKFNPNSVTNTINKVNSILGQQKLQSPNLGGASGQGMLPLPSEMLSPIVSMSSNKSDSMQMVACPECQLEFPGIDLLQAHISVSHKHLDVKLPNSSAGTAAVAQAAAAAVASAATAASSQDSNGSNDHDASGGADGRPSWHAALEDSQEPFKCNICGKGFQKTSKLTAHMKIHRYVHSAVRCSMYIVHLGLMYIVVLLYVERRKSVMLFWKIGGFLSNTLT